MGVLLMHLAATDATAQNRSLSVVGGNVTLVVGSSAPFPGADLEPVSSSTGGLDWRTGPGGNRKITVSSDAPGQSFPLAIVAINIVGPATPLSAVPLTDGMAPRDLLRNLKAASGNESGSCTLRYTAHVSVVDGNSNTHGDDQHIVTFTLVDQ
ncbi:hypothetical protein BH23BAC4_BH23BAC4_08200 [soil metagenome]